jgi:hypothetical protein
VEPVNSFPLLPDLSLANTFIAVGAAQTSTNLGLFFQSFDRSVGGDPTFLDTGASGGNLNEWFQLTGRWSTNWDFSIYDWGTNGLAVPRLIVHMSTRGTGINNPRIAASTNLFFGVCGGAAFGLSLDNITVTEAPLMLSSPVFDGGAFRFSVSGSPNVTSRIDSATGPSNWSTIGSVVLSNGRATFLDTNAGNYPFRLYRAARQ